jgi:hypothetical protein
MLLERMIQKEGQPEAFAVRENDGFRSYFIPYT